MRVAEKVLQDYCLRYFRHRGFAVEAEVPLLSKIADIYGVHRVSGCTIAVEVKIGDWRRGMVQAEVYTLFATNVYLALHADCVDRVDRVLLNQHGFGLLSVNEYADVVEISEPTCSNAVVPFLEERTFLRTFHESQLLSPPGT